jgi:hypothetical protein
MRTQAPYSFATQHARRDAVTSRDGTAERKRGLPFDLEMDREQHG